MQRSIPALLVLTLWLAPVPAPGQGLQIQKQGTRLAHITRDGKPLLAFGCHLESMFLTDNDPDYTVWSAWAQAHGINHGRVRIIQPKLGDKYKPYVSAGKGKYDLTRFDPVFWERFRAICVNLRDHGIVMHLLVFPHNGHVRNGPWRESLFNPAHNVNAQTSHLGGSNHYQFWHSVADRQTGLWEIQRATVIKIAELTADLDNVYYDLSHEFRTDSSGAQPTDWNKARQFFEAVADTLRTTYARLQPGQKPLIGLDAEHFAKAGQLDWNFRHPAFDLMILGNSSTSPVPSLETVSAWRGQYRKPFLLQEGGADDDRGGKLYIGYHGTDPVIIRKYVWKWMMAKNQFINLYQKENAPDKGYPDNYDPRGHSRFEDDALVLRAFWNSLHDYGNLDYVGRIAAGPGFRRMVLSSEREAVAYMASEMGRVGIEYGASHLELADLSLADGSYTVDIWKPAAPNGLVRTVTCTVTRGSATIALPAFTDDLAVHLHRAASAGPRAYLSTDIVASKGGRAGSTKLSVEGNRFLVNGKPFYMWGIRVASASQSEEYTRHLLAQLDSYRAHGVNALTVFFQGSSGGYCDPFSPDGSRIDPAHLDRMKRIIEACDEREMVVIVGIIYQRAIQHKRRLMDAAAVRNAVRTVARELASYDNIIINIANEQNSSRYRDWAGYDFRNPENIIDLCRAVREQDPKRLVGGGGYDDQKSLAIGLSPHVDVLLFDTTGPDADNSSGWHHDYFVEHGVRDKPIVNVELYGGWTGQFKDPPGHFPEAVKRIYYRDADEAAARPGLSVFFHSNIWCQGPSDGFPLRYDLAGPGTKDDPGIHWYFDHVQSRRTD